MPFAHPLESLIRDDFTTVRGEGEIEDSSRLAGNGVLVQAIPNNDEKNFRT